MTDLVRHRLASGDELAVRDLAGLLLLVATDTHSGHVAALEFRAEELVELGRALIRAGVSMSPHPAAQGHRWPATLRVLDGGRLDAS